MPLSGSQIVRLAKELAEQWDLAQLSMFAIEHLSISLEALAPSGGLKERAVKLITALNSSLPPRDRELLEKLLVSGNPRLRDIASELLTPSFFSPTDDPHDAIVLGRAVFVDRIELRHNLRDFTRPSAHSTRVLIVRGMEPCGKSYSWSFLHHLAVTCVGAVPKRIQLRGTSYTPRQLFEQIFLLLDLDLTKLPSMSDEPQYARMIHPLTNALMGQVVNLRRPYWLVIDDINDPGVTKEIRDAVYMIAYNVECDKPENLWVALLGYNEYIIDHELRWAALDDARFPDATLLAEHFRFIADAGPRPLTKAEADQYANLLLAKFPELTKESMTKLTLLIEKMGEKLKAGERP